MWQIRGNYCIKIAPSNKEENEKYPNKEIDKGIKEKSHSQKKYYIRSVNLWIDAQFP